MTTHVHWDHIGGHGLFEDLSVHELEQEWLESSFPLPEDAVRQNLTCMSRRFPEGFDPAAYHVFQGKASHLLHDGDSIDLGNRKITVIHTPGHSPGHCCFWEADRQYLYTGDLIYSGFLFAYYPSTDPYQFWQSLRKVRELPVRKILPGHNHMDISTDIIGRIETAFPQLKEMYGRTKGILLGGVIWGAWHWPLIWLIGYEYGTDYPGFPVVGMLVFCVFTIGLGILHDVLYEKNRCIWIPALLHGSLNGAATIPLAICRTDTGPARLLGPVPNGLIAVLPILVCAVIILLKTKQETVQ